MYIFVIINDFVLYLFSVHFGRTIDVATTPGMSANGKHSATASRNELLGDS